MMYKVEGKRNQCNLVRSNNPSYRIRGTVKFLIRLCMMITVIVKALDKTHFPTDKYRHFPYLSTKTITKICLYNFDPLKPHFYIVKLGFVGVYIIFLILLKNIDYVYSLEPPRRGGSNEYPQSIF